MRKVQLKKYQVLDAYRTAPVDMGPFGLLLRIAGTFHDSLYGKAVFDAVVVGDDPLAALSAASAMQRSGKTVLIAPDSVNPSDWPTDDWGVQLARLVNDFDDSVAAIVRAHLHSFRSRDGYMKALKLLADECAGSGRVTILQGEYLQSSQGLVKGCMDQILFPLRAEYQHFPVLNPLWRLVAGPVQSLRFQWREIEFIQARRVFFTTPPSRFIDISVGKVIGLAREGNSKERRRGRADDIESAFVQTLGRQ